MIQTDSQITVPQPDHLADQLQAVERFGADPQVSDAFVGPGLAMLEKRLTSTVRLISFDVFETLVTRRTGSPEAEFLFIGRRLRERGLIRSTAASFARTRYACEKRARGNKSGREITLREIYEEITCFLGLDANLDAMIQVELEMERETIAAVPAMVGLVDEARRRFGSVVFVSDMYLPQDSLEDRLDELGIYKPGDRLYLSSTESVQKGDTRLFEVVLKREKLKPQELFHVGNSFAYDVVPAERLGVGHYHFERGNPSPSEQILNDFADASDGATSLLAGAARRARLSGIHLDGDERAVWETGASVTGPLVWMYAQWILARAAQKNIRQLYFLARDAYPVYLAVQTALRHRPELGMTARYIYGSRPTYYAMGIERLGEEEWGVLTSHAGHQYRTLNTLCAGLMAGPEVLRPHLESIGLATVDWDRELTDQEIAVVRRHALEDESFNRGLMDNLRAYTDLQRRYFMQEGFDPENGVALVDTGWTSRSHAPLFHFLAGMGCANLRLFYIGLMVEEAYVPLDSIDTFMFNRATKQGVMSHRMIYTRALETLFTSFHGRTTGFTERNGRVEPVFAPPEDASFVDRYMALYFRAIRAYLDQMRPCLVPFDGVHNTREVFERVLYRFWEKPTRAEAHAWSQITWEWDPQGQVRHALAVPYRPQHAVPGFIQNRVPMLYPQFWREGAKRLTPPPVLFFLRCVILLRRIMDKGLGVIPPPLRRSLREARRKLIRFEHH
ncbi:MAG: hypothetical protein AAF710_00965 [Planctomycetota bacterium]